MSGPARVDAALIALAAHAVRRLVQEEPALCLWAPGREAWGLALLRGGGRAVVALDGCLAIAAAAWPERFAAGGRYPLDAVARRLAGTLPLETVDGHGLFACRLPGAGSGACCVLLAARHLPWLADPEAVPLPAAGAWTAPSAAPVAPP